MVTLWNTPHLGLKRHKVIISAIPLFNPGSAAEPGGRLNPNHFTQGGTSIVRDIIACLLAQWPPDSWHLNFQSSLHHPQSRCATCLSYLTQCVPFSPLFNPVDIIGSFFPSLYSSLVSFRRFFLFFCFFLWWLCEHVSLVLFLPFFGCLSMHSTLGVSGTGTRLDLIEWLLLEH